MNIKSLFKGATALALVLSGATGALAAGTVAGSSVVNTATLNYSVGGVAQNPVSASNTFVVDRKISLTLTGAASTTSVSPGQSNAVTVYQLTNTSNATLDFGLSLAQLAGGAAVHGGTDTFDVTGPTFWVNTGASAGSATYDPANSVQVTYIDELAADTSKYVFVLANIPVARVNADVSGQVLTAQALEGGAAASQGAVVTQTAGANTAGMDTVFADTAGSTDAARDGKYSAGGDYTVSGALLTITKTSRVISDPFNGTTNPKMVPGAVVEYCIQAANGAGAATASNVAISDPLPSQTAYSAPFGIFINGTVTAGSCNADGTAGGTFASGTVSATLASVPAGTARSVYFRATIN